LDPLLHRLEHSRLAPSKTRRDEGVLQQLSGGRSSCRVENKTQLDEVVQLGGENTDGGEWRRAAQHVCQEIKVPR